MAFTSRRGKGGRAGAGRSGARSGARLGARAGAERAGGRSGTRAGAFGFSPSRLEERLAEALFRLISRIPASKAVAERTPADRSKLLILHASSRAALTSATLSIPPGPLGLATVLPDLMAIWRIQRQLVADIAALHGKTARLGREEMAYCLFRHAAGQVVRDVVMRAGERYVVRRTSMEMLRSMLRRVGVSISERAAGRAASRWLPVVGAVGIGAYAYYDTAQVGKTALAFFAADIDDTRDQAGTQT